MKEERNKSFFRRVFRNGFLFVSHTFMFLLLFSILGRFVPPTWTSLFAFGGLAFPFLFFPVLIFLILLFIRRYRRTFVIYVMLLIYPTYLMGGYWQSGLFNSDPPENGTVKVMTYNVKLFDLYNWTKNIHSRDQIYDFMKEENPDIMCLQEYFYRPNSDFATTDTLITFLSAKNVHTSYPVLIKPEQHFGIATYTRFPIISKGEIRFKGTSNMAIFTDVVINGDTVRIYNNHLESIRFGSEDYRFISDIDLDVDSSEIKEAKGVFKRLNHAFIVRSGQADSIAEHIAACPYPVIVCGDFNDTPISYAYRKMSGGLKDAYRESGSGFGNTYAGKFPSFRIDYILYSPGMESYDYRSPHIELSDHYPVVCLLGRKEE